VLLLCNVVGILICNSIVVDQQSLQTVQNY